MTFTISFSSPQVGISFDSGGMDIEAGNQIIREYIDVPAYEGPYSVTPSEETQVLSGRNKKMTEDIVVNPIPDNYCRFLWDGTSITVY